MHIYYYKFIYIYIYVIKKVKKISILVVIMDACITTNYIRAIH